MQFNEENIKALTHYLDETMSHDKSRRTMAENYLKQISAQPGFSVLLLRLLELPIPDNIKLSAAIFFKNLVKQNWINKESNFIPLTDREQIKSTIVTLMLSAPRKVQQQLSAALELISEHDFPNEWQNLLPELVAKLQTQDFNVINGILRTATAIFKRYRVMMKNQNVLVELKYVLEIFQAPLLQLFQATYAAIEQNKANTKFTSQAFQAVKSMLKIFYSLNHIDLPEFFEDHMTDWMTLFRNLLMFDSQDSELVGDEDDEEPGLLHKVKACVCENINLYAEKYEEEFNPYYETFLKDIWTMLMKLPTDSKYDSLVISGIRFLTILANGVYYNFFKAPELIKTVCEQIVIPSLKLRPVDLELFEDNPIEYIRRDIEGSDSDTRRRAATELVKGLRKHYEREVTQICSAYIGAMLQQYAANPVQSWGAKDVAIYLVTALAIRGSTQKEGTTNVNELVPVLEFFANQIIPELQTDSPAAQILKADALKFVTTFRQQLPKEAFVTVLPLVIKNLTSNNHVVKTYAANSIEKLLVVKDRVGGQHVARISRAELKPILADLLSNLFKAVEDSAQVKENDYVMKAIMRVIATVQEDILPYSAKCIQVLVSILNRVYQNPTNPSFTHYLFESIASMVKSVAAGSPDALAAFEKVLFEPFTKILELDIQEFAPYVFQILSVFLEVRTTPGLSDLYLAILPPLLTPLLWERVSNIPALVRLVQAYLKRGGKQVIQAGQLEPILGVFKEKLVFSKTRDHEGFYLLESMVEFLAPEDFAKYMPTIFTLIFTRLTQSKTTKFVKHFLVWLSLFIGKHGAGLVVQVVDSVQPNLFVNILDSLWLPNVQKVMGPIERKMASVAMTKMLVEPKLMVDPYASFWPKILSAAVALLELPEDETGADEEIEVDDVAGYDVSGSGFSPLHHASKGNADPFPDVQSKPFLAMALYKLCRDMPGRFPSVVGTLHPEAQAHLMSYFKAVPTLAEPYLV